MFVSGSAATCVGVLFPATMSAQIKAMLGSCVIGAAGTMVQTFAAPHLVSYCCSRALPLSLLLVARYHCTAATIALQLPLHCSYHCTAATIALLTVLALVPLLVHCHEWHEPLGITTSCSHCGTGEACEMSALGRCSWSWGTCLSLQ